MDFIKTAFDEFKNRERDSSNPQRIRTCWATVLLVITVAIFVCVYLSWAILPGAWSADSERDNGIKFIAERAYNELDTFTQTGPRVTGSSNNELFAVNYIKNSVMDIISRKNAVHSVELDHQTASGVYTLNGFVLAYVGVQNVVAKITATNAPEPDHYLILNSHFDTVRSSPGASDGGCMVVTMLEVLRTLTLFTNPLKYGVIFVWNGSKESGLQGAHAFITQHKWAPKVKAFINLDATGCDSREQVFQFGSKNRWMMDHYQSAVPHPYGSTLAEEYAQSIAQPFDSDYLIYRDYGNIPGLELTHRINSYRHQTPSDVIDGVYKNSLQHTGDNVLALVRELANARELAKEREPGGEDFTVYYDFLNLFIIQYTRTTSTTINLTVAGVTVIVIVMSMLVISQNNCMSTRVLMIEFGAVTVTQIVSLSIAAAVTFLLSYFYNAIGCSMRWYTAKWLLVGMYFCPIWLCLSVGPLIYEKYRKQVLKLDAFFILPLRIVVKMFIYVQLLLLSILLMALTLAGVQSAYVIMVVLFCYMMFDLINVILEADFSFSKSCIHGWLYIQLLGQIIPFLYISSAMLTMLGLVVPNQSRIGENENPEMTICIVVLLSCILISGFIMPLVLLLRNRWIIPFLFGIVAVVFMIIMATPAGFPYNEIYAPVPITVLHSQQYDEGSSDMINRYILFASDQYGSRLIEDTLGPSMEPANKNDKRTTKFDRARHYLAAPPVFSFRTDLTLIQKRTISTNLTRYFFEIVGTDHIDLKILLNDDQRIVDWVFRDRVSPPLLADGYHGIVHQIRFVFGRYDNLTPYYFSIDVEGKADDLPPLRISISTSFGNFEKSWTPAYYEFLAQFPPYVGFLSDVENYVKYKF